MKEETMETQWYYAQQGQRLGPVSSEQLKELAAAGRLQPSDLVWKEGMAQWAAADRIEGLFSAVQAPTPGSPPPLPPSGTGEMPPLSAAAAAQAPRANTAMQPAVLRQKIEGLRQSLVQEVLNPQVALPNVEPIATFRKEHSQLQEQLRQLQHRLQELGKAKAEYELLDNACQQQGKELAAAEKALVQLARPLGKAAFEGLLAGLVQDQPTFKDRFAVHQRIGELQAEHDRFAPPSDAGMIQKTKAKAQQLVAAGKIKLEEMKIGKLEEQIGRELIASNQEESVRCDHTAEILTAFAKHRGVIAHHRQVCETAREALDTKCQELAQTLQMAGTTKSFDAERQSCEAQIAQVEHQGRVLKSELLVQLVTCGESLSVEGILGQRLRELRDTQAQLSEWFHSKGGQQLATADGYININIPSAVGVGTLIGLIVGYPLSYFFQPGLLRAMVSLADYIQHIDMVFSDKHLVGTAVGVWIGSVIVFALIGRMLSVAINKKRDGNP